MRGAIWFMAGAGAGIYALVRGRRAAEAFTADGLRDRAQALGVGARIFREELAVGKAEKELELREWIDARTAGPKQIGATGVGQQRLGLTGPENEAQQNTEGSTP
jgi:hypothetical protein